MKKNTESYEGVVINSLFESLEGYYDNFSCQDVFSVKSVKARRVPAEERRLSSISTKELYECMSV